MIFSRIYPYTSEWCISDYRVEDVVSDLITNFNWSSCNFIKIIDPFLHPGSFLDFLGKGCTDNPSDFLTVLYRFRMDYFPTLDSFKILTCRHDFLKNLFNERRQYQVKINFPNDRYNYLLLKVDEITFEIVQYSNPKKSTSNHPDIPTLHDRWIIWGNQKTVEGIQIGPSLDDFIRKDISVTCFMDDAIDLVNKRFDYLFEVGKQR